MQKDFSIKNFRFQVSSFKLVTCGFWLAATLASCSPISKTSLTKQFRSIETALKDHTGFMLYDMDKKREIFSYQADRYFTPASNTKIFTLYASLMVLGDSIPALRYAVKGDSLIFKGTGDPSFLYKGVCKSDRVFAFLSATNKRLFLSNGIFSTEPFGPGWAWDDFAYTYSVERSPFPVYGNYFSLKRTGRAITVHPSSLAFQISLADSTQESSVVRDIGSNKITVHPGKMSQLAELWEIPFRTSDELTASLLSDTLKKNVTISTTAIDKSSRVLYSIPSDSLYKAMMQESDNFIAEQLLLLCSQVLSDSLKPEIVIRYMKKNHLHDLPDDPIWVDGSGLSRYNLFTPRSIVKLWEKIYKEVPRDRLFPLLAIGGKTGTVKKYYKNDPPYLYGKTGTLSNSHSLSGYLVTKKGHTLIFSFMNNNYTTPTKEVRTQMEKVLKDIYLHF